MLSRRRFIEGLVVFVGGVLLYDGPYAGLEITNFLESKTVMTVRIVSLEGPSFQSERTVTPPPGGGGTGFRQAFPAAIPATYRLTIDVRDGPSKSFRVGFGVNDGNQHVHVTIQKNGRMEMEMNNRPIAIP